MSLPPLWMERFERTEREYQIRASLEMPSVKEIDFSIEVMQSMIAEGAIKWPFVEFTQVHQDENEIGDYTIPIKSGIFDPRHPAAFRMIAPVAKYLENTREMATQWGLDGNAEAGQAWSILYNLYHWKKSGRRVYVMSPELYELLRVTKLPDWYFHEVNFPLQSFYVVFPPGAFAFNIHADPDPQPAEGMFVGISDTIGNPEDSRELAMLVTGRSPRGNYDDNIAWGQLGIGPHSKLPDIKFAGYDRVAAVGGTVMTHTLPHIILAFVLYLESEHPDLVPVQGPKKQSFNEVRSPKIREKLLRRQELRFTEISRLSYIHVGSQIGKNLRSGVLLPGTGRALTVQQNVAGHFKMQAHGPRMELRKKIFVHDYLRGPDVAEQVERMVIQKIPDAKVKA
jgi:hypothetical protein